MSSPEIGRRVRQQGADIDSLYELTTAIDQKVDALTERVESLSERVDAGFAAMEAKFDVLLDRLGNQK